MGQRIPGTWLEKTWLEIPVGKVKNGTPDDLRRLATTYSNVGPSQLPNGLPRPEGVKIEAAFRLGGDFQFIARVVRTERRTLLQIESEAFDVQRRRRVLLEPAPELVEQIYADLARRYLAAKQQAYGRGEGRN